MFFAHLGEILVPHHIMNECSVKGTTVLLVCAGRCDWGKVKGAYCYGM